VHITRREFALGTGALTVTGVGALIGFSLVGTGRPALAQNPPLAELMQPGPLGDMSLGDEKAPVTIIEYASMTCPHCANFHETTYPELKKKYIDTGKVRFIFREFPLEQLAAAASMLARCGGKERFSRWSRPCFSSSAHGRSSAPCSRSWPSASKPASARQASMSV